MSDGAGAAQGAGFAMPHVGMGTAVQGPRPEPIRRAVLKAIEAGYPHFDTAAHYEIEAPIGEATAEAVRSGAIASRGDLFITSKLWCSDAHSDRVLPALRHTLRNLQMDYVDLYLVHWPMSMKLGRYKAPFTADDFVSFDMRAVWKAMEECHRLGLAKAIGVCNFSCKKLDTLLSFANIPPAVNQINQFRHIATPGFWVIFLFLDVFLIRAWAASIEFDLQARSEFRHPRLRWRG